MIKESEFFPPERPEEDGEVERAAEEFVETEADRENRPLPGGSPGI